MNKLHEHINNNLDEIFRPLNDLLCVKWAVKLYTRTHMKFNKPKQLKLVTVKYPLIKIKRLINHKFEKIATKNL